MCKHFKQLTFAEWLSFKTHEILNLEAPNEFIHSPPISVESNLPKYYTSGIAFILHGTDPFKATIVNTNILLNVSQSLLTLTYSPF